MVQTSQHLLVCSADASGMRYCAVHWAPPKISAPKDYSASEAECLHLHTERRESSLHKDRSSSRHAGGSGVCHMPPVRQVWAQHLQKAVFPLVSLKNTKTFQWGHRWTLRAMGLCKQLFAQTNVQQVSVHRWLSVVLAHAPLISVM